MTDDTGARRAVVALMLLGIALDAAVAPASGAALPAVRASLRLSEAAATWSTVLFNGCYFTAIVLSLWASTRLGKRVYLVSSFFGFALAAAICAVAPDGAVFVLGRALAGLALGGLFATCLLTFAATSPKRDLTAVFAVFAFLALATPTGTPLVTGIVIGAGGWRAVFALFALAALAIGFPALRLLRDPRPAQRLPFDAASAAALFVAFGAFSLFTERASATAFADPGAVAALLLAMLAGIAFAARELGDSPAPFLDLAVLRARVVARGIGVCFALGMLIAGGEVQLQYARAALHIAPAHASAVLALRIVGIVLGGALAVVLTKRAVPDRALVTAGFAAIALAFVAQGAVTAYALGETALSGVMLLHGFGFALVMGPLGSLLFAAVTPAQMPALVVLFKITVGVGDAFAAPLVAAFLALETAAGRIPAWAYADVWAAGALLACAAAFGAVALRGDVAAAAVAA